MSHIESINCKYCESASHNLFLIDKQLHSMCRNCGRIIDMIELLAESKEMKNLEKRNNNA